MGDGGDCLIIIRVLLGSSEIIDAMSISKKENSFALIQYFGDAITI
jgi:hypothetical protein